MQYSTFDKIYNREDLIVRDLTGSGKTLAFSLPVVEYLRAGRLFGTGKTQALILAPTRELAVQISKVVNSLKHHSHEYQVLSVYGGVSISSQANRMRDGVDIIVGTTGRVMDHMRRGNLNDFAELKTMILDEADSMLDMGFKEDVDWILDNIKKTVPKHPQFLLFSATVPNWVQSMAD